MKYIIALLAFANCAYAHEMTPTYFSITSSFVEGVSNVRMKLFNRRVDVNYYEFSVYDKKWNLIPYASSERLVKIDYLDKKEISIYIRDEDARKVEYICSISRLLKEDVTSTPISSRICSKAK